MTYQLRAVAVLPVDLGLIPSTYKVAHNQLELQFRESGILIWPLMVPTRHVVHR